MTLAASAETATRRRLGVSLRRRAATWRLEGSGWLGERLARPRELARPVVEVVSPAAWALAGFALLALVVGFWLEWNELGAAAFAGLALLAVSTVFLIGTTNLDSALDLSRDRVVVGERANGRLLVQNRSGRRTLPLRVELPIGDARADFELPMIRGHESHEQLFAVPTDRRAVLAVGPVTAVRADPLLLLRREQKLTAAEELFIHPRTVPIDGSAAGMVRDLEGRSTRQLTDSDVSFHALRPYVPGDDRRHIHWKHTVRTGVMMVRQFEQTRRSHLLVVLSTRLDDYGHDDEFETAVSIVASLGIQTLREKHTLSITTSTAQLTLPSPRSMLDQLSGVDFERGAPLTSVTARRVGRDVRSPSVVIVLAGTNAESSELRRAARLFPVDARRIVMRCRADARPLSVRAFGGVDMVSISDLDDLGPFVRRLS